MFVAFLDTLSYTVCIPASLHLPSQDKNPRRSQNDESLSRCINLRKDEWDQRRNADAKKAGTHCEGANPSNKHGLTDVHRNNREISRT